MSRVTGHMSRVTHVRDCLKSTFPNISTFFRQKKTKDVGVDFVVGFELAMLWFHGGLIVYLDLYAAHFQKKYI